MCRYVLSRSTHKTLDEVFRFLEDVRNDEAELDQTQSVLENLDNHMRKYKIRLKGLKENFE